MGTVFCCVCFSFTTGCDLGNSNADEVDGQIFYDNDPGSEITDVGFAGGAGPFTIPSGYGDCNGLWIEIDVKNNSASGIELHLNLTPAETIGSDFVISLQPGDGSKEIHFIRLNNESEGTDLYLWHNEDDLGATADLTDVTIQADIIYWLFIGGHGAAN
jgi:hypothetical protein